MKQHRPNAEKKSSTKEWDKDSSQNEEEFFKYKGTNSTNHFTLVSCVATIFISLYIALASNKNNETFLPIKNETFILAKENVTATETISIILNKTDHLHAAKNDTSFNKPNNVVKQSNKKSLLFNAYDLKIKHKIYEGEQYKRQHAYPKCISHFENLFKKHPKSPQAVYGQAVCLGLLADQMRSNEILTKSIEAFGCINQVPDVPKELLKLALLDKSKKERFIGRIRDSAKTLISLNIQLESDVEVRTMLVDALLMMGANSQALTHIEKTLAIDPENGLANCHKGFILQQAKNYEEAIKYLSEGIRNIKPSDTRQDLFYFNLGDAYTRVGKPNEAWKVYHEAAEKGIFPSAEQRSMYNAKTTLRAQPIWTAEQAGYKKEISLLEYHWKTIRSEAMSILNKDKNGFQHETESLLQQGDWRQFELYVQARKIKSNCAKTPKTCSVIDQMSAAATNKRGQVKFSVMQPGTHIWPHTGPTNCRLRAHLGLKIPKNTSIRVSSHTTTWKEGKVLIIDDSFDHEVWHNGSDSRLILIVDFWHPDIPNWERRQLTPI